MKLKRMLLSFLTIALLVTLIFPSSFVSAQNNHLQPQSEVTISQTETLGEYQDHSHLARELSVPVGSYEELKSDPNAPRKTYYYVEFSSTENNTVSSSVYSEGNSANSSVASEPTITVVPEHEYQKFIEDKKREYSSDTTLRGGKVGGIGVIVTLRSHVWPTIESSAVVDTLVGNKPKMIQFHTTFYRNDTRSYGGWAVSTTYKKEYQKSDVRVGAGANHFHSVTQTGFYYSISKLKIFDGFIIVVPVGEKDFLSNMILLNSKGVAYPYYYDNDARRVLPEPTSASYPKGKRPNQKWGTTERNNFIKDYNRVYPWNRINWAGEFTEVHHIKPQDRHGDNSFYNLMPLPRSFHRSVVSPWWTAY
ncbi:HNH endonuclease [Paenibacillus sp. 481]|uniref:HNH endonuclease n=1 Tax=Paenibacillus sp. 481 TaxID=2835869 RepID=UPI001E36A9E8|nr:HNH endonuclease signature motif containing protein [Paenibacillus sp. 481]UHA72059.1 HNH endonuclease [Paenibacillus sp. 481]